MDKRVFDRLLTLGFEDEKNEMFSLWREIAGHERLEAASIKKYEYPRDQVNSKALVLLNWTLALKFRRADLDVLLTTGASVIVYLAKGETLSVSSVINNVPGQLRDYCSGEFFRRSSFRWRLDKILKENKIPYNPFLLTRPKGGKVVPNPKSVFLATPLDEDLYGPFYEGATAAMNAVGIKILSPVDEPGTTEINRAVLDDIDASDVVIANLRQKKSDDERGYNPNVLYEIGYAWKANKPVLLYRHVNDWIKRPSDIQASPFHEYCDAIDLALQLFYGFGGNGTPNTP